MRIGIGAVVMAGAVINPAPKIGKGYIINTCLSAEHDYVIGNYVRVSADDYIAGTVIVAEQVLRKSNNVNILGDRVIGSGSVIVSNIRYQICIKAFLPKEMGMH